MAQQLNGCFTNFLMTSINRFYPGVGGVDIYRDCYRGRFEHCGWQLLGSSVDLPPLSSGTASVLPIVSEHFDPRSIYMFGIDPNNPSVNLRFTVGAITVGGEPQIANNNPLPDGLGDEILSDCFNRGDQPAMVYSWAVISTSALGSPLVFDVFNLNASAIRIFIAMWGNAMTDEFIKKWRGAEQDDKSLYIVQNNSPGEQKTFDFIVRPNDELKTAPKVKKPKKIRRRLFGLGRRIGKIGKR